MRNTLSLFVLVNGTLSVLAFAIVALLVVRGWSVTDETGIVWAILALFCVGLVEAARAVHARERWASVRFVANSLVYLGLIGTVVGFIVALGGVEAVTAGDTDRLREMVARLVSGMGTALQTTLVGALGYLWLSAVAFVVAGESV